MNIILGQKTYEDKVRACWIGKNIGGTMGAPFEGMREVLDVKGYTTDPGTPLPNDDLDLQLVWLHALEYLGPSGINASNLGELWLSLIPPHWNEYGICKANMQRGLRPPVSGDYESTWSHSNGAWIRTEIWACTAPALPALAAKHAAEDAKVDHGAGEGTHAAAFVAAMQSAAFALDNLYDCIDVGLAAIPESSRVAKTVKFVLECYESGKTWLEARNAVLEMNSDIGDGWFEAPSNVGFTLIGLVWGEGDFKKSMLTAINCGDDTDCTAATVGATLGILYGTAGIPKDWEEYIGDTIVTISINRGSVGNTLPKTCTELSERVIDIAPVVVGMHRAFERWDTWLYRVSFGDKTLLDVDDAKKQMLECVGLQIRPKLEALRPLTLEFRNAFLEATVVLSDVKLEPCKQINVNLDLMANKCADNATFSAQAHWYLPEGFTVSGPKNLFLPNRSRHTDAHAIVDFTVTVPEDVPASAKCILEIRVNGRHTDLFIPIVFLG